MAAPAPIGVTVDLAQLNQVLTEVAHLASDLRPVFRARIAPDVASQLTQQFATRGAHLGTPWAPLSLTTIRLRTKRTVTKGGYVATTNRPGQARGGFATPMQNTRRLFQSLTKVATVDGIRVYEAGRMVWGTALPYAEPHHRAGGFDTKLFGKGPLRHVPERPVVPREWPAPIATAWAGMIADYLEGA